MSTQQATALHRCRHHRRCEGYSTPLLFPRRFHLGPVASLFALLPSSVAPAARVAAFPIARPLMMGPLGQAERRPRAADVAVAAAKSAEGLVCWPSPLLRRRRVVKSATSQPMLTA